MDPEEFQRIYGARPSIDPRIVEEASQHLTQLQWVDGERVLVFAEALNTASSACDNNGAQHILNQLRGWNVAAWN